MRFIHAHWQTILYVALFWFLYNQFRAPAYSRGTPAPDFTIRLADQSELQLSDLEGRYILLDFWASWCGPCRRDNPSVVSVYQQFEEKEFKNAEGFDIVSISLDRNPNKWLEAIKKDNLYWSYHSLDQSTDFEQVSDLYKVERIPTKYIISPEGNIIGTNWSAARLRLFLKQRVKK